MLDVECSCRFSGDQADASECLLHGAKCFYCDRRGGVPFLMVGDELHCSRCFEDFTPAQFLAYLNDYPVEVEVLEPEAERPALVAMAQGWRVRKPAGNATPKKRKVA